jgi:hypothetical protein
LKIKAVKEKHVRIYNKFYIYYMTDIEEKLNLPEPLKVKYGEEIIYIKF